MSKGQMLKALVSERLTAAAEEIFALFEKTIADYEEELCRSTKENQQLRSTRVHRAGTPAQTLHLNQEIRETQIKEEPEEQSDKQEEEQVLVSDPESKPICVKTGEASLFQQGQIEHPEETLGEDISSEPHFHSETEGDTEHSYDTDNDWEPPFICLDEEMETAAIEDNHNSVRLRVRSTKKCPPKKSAPETSAVNNVDTSRTYKCAEKNKPQCAVCQPYSCTTCKKTFAKKSYLVAHRRIHTGEKAYSCSLCNRSYSNKDCLTAHMRTHTGENLHSCSMCEKSFGKKSHLDIHMRSHTGEKPYSCLFCDKAFSVNSNLTRHLRTHTEEKQ